MNQNQLMDCQSGVAAKRDVVFKILFTTPKWKSCLKDFLESILDIHIKDLSADIATEMLPEFYDGKRSYLDIRVKLSDNTQVNIEMQAESSGYNDRRCLLYWNRVYSHNLKIAQNYKELNKTICIWICNDDIFKEFPEYESKWVITNQEHLDVKKFSDLEFHFFELKKFRNCDKIELSKKNLWMWFIDYTNQEMIDMACVSNEEIKKAKEALAKIYANDELRTIIMLDELEEIDRNTREYLIEQKATEQGAKEKQLEIAKSLKKLNVEIAKIVEATGLSIEEIESL